MNVRRVKLTKNHMWGRAGSTIEVSEDVAKRLVQSEFGVIVEDDYAPKAKKPSNKSLAAR